MRFFGELQDRLVEKFWSSFFKSLRSGGRGALLVLRRARNVPFGVSLLLAFLLRLHRQEKSG